MTAMKRKQITGIPAFDLFNDYVEILHNRGCLVEIIRLLGRYFTDVGLMPEIIEKEKEAEGILFVPVIPTTFYTLRGLLLMVELNGNAGRMSQELKQAQLQDLIETPKNPYFLIDVEYGTEMFDLSPADAEQAIVRRGRSPLTTQEIISLGIFSKGNDNILPESPVLCALGSSINGQDVPVLVHWNTGGTIIDYEPILHLAKKDESHQSIFRYGKPSCKLRL